jgi:hypothetical protein
MAKRRRQKVEFDSPNFGANAAFALAAVTEGG